MGDIRFEIRSASAFWRGPGDPPHYTASVCRGGRAVVLYSGVFPSGVAPFRGELGRWAEAVLAARLPLPDGVDPSACYTGDAPEADGGEVVGWRLPDDHPLGALLPAEASAALTAIERDEWARRAQSAHAALQGISDARPELDDLLRPVLAALLGR